MHRNQIELQPLHEWSIMEIARPIRPELLAEAMPSEGSCIMLM